MIIVVKADLVKLFKGYGKDLEGENDFRGI